MLCGPIRSLFATAGANFLDNFVEDDLQLVLGLGLLLGREVAEAATASSIDLGTLK